jgi:Cyclic nucleotide-binding domain
MGAYLLDEQGQLWWGPMNLDNADLAATIELIFHRSMDAAAAAINLANMFALMGAVFFVATLLMRTIVPLRIAALISDVFFIGYGVLSNSINTLILYGLLLPINSIRLYQMIKLIRKARVSAQGDLSMNWLKPFMIRRTYRKGDVLFRKGEPASEMFLTVTVKLLVTEIGIEIPPGRLVGELGFLSPDNRRTQTVECLQDGEVLTMTYDRLLEIYFQNPEFGYYFLRLSSERLLQNIARLESIIEQSRAKDTNCNQIEPEIPTGDRTFTPRSSGVVRN